MGCILSYLINLMLYLYKKYMCVFLLGLNSKCVCAFFLLFSNYDDEKMALIKWSFKIHTTCHTRAHIINVICFFVSFVYRPYYISLAIFTGLRFCRHRCHTSFLRMFFFLVCLVDFINHIVCPLDSAF